MSWELRMKSAKPSKAAGTRKVGEKHKRGQNGTSKSRSRSIESLSEELVEFEKGMPAPDFAAQNADARWIDEHWQQLLKEFPGTHIAVLDQRVVGHGVNSLELQLNLARQFNIHPERPIIVYIPEPGWSWK